jgi:hypothetical protein
MWEGGVYVYLACGALDAVSMMVVTVRPATLNRGLVASA